MDIDKRLSMSFYQNIATLNQDHNIYMVQHNKTNKIYVKKILDVYNKSLYESLMTHPINHIPRIVELYEEGNTLTVIEEYITGKTLSEMLDSKHCFTTTQIASIVSNLCDILADFHSFDPPIIHRDIKPSNIILTTSGDIYLIDFNAAKYESHDKEEDTTLLGTKGYAAPEQYGFGVSNPQTDIYAIGMLMNTLIRGEFSNNAIEGHEFTPIIKKCIELRPNDRYKSVSEIKKNLSKLSPTAADAKTSNSNRFGSYLPPGFRSKNILKMLLSSGVYLLLAWVCLSLEVKNANPAQLQIERIGTLILFLIFIFVLFDYRGVADRFPLCTSSKKLLRILGRILFSLIVSTIYFFILLTIVCIL